MALMAPTQASPAPHPNDFHPDFPNLRNLHCSALENHSLTEKHLLPPQRSSDDSTGDPPAFFC